MSTQMKHLLLTTLVLLSINIVESQPAPLPTPGYEACYQIESDPPCNDTFYVSNYGCDWDNIDKTCMCIAGDDNINVIILLDISTIGAPTPTEFNYIAHLLEDVIDSTLNLRDGSTVAFNQIILYHEQNYPMPENTDATSINIDQCCGSRTQFNNLSGAIDTAINLFNGLDASRNVLVIFNGQRQSDYPDDNINICPLKQTLDNQGMPD